MNDLKKIMRIHFLVVFFVLLLSCGAVHNLRDTVIYKDSDFSYNHLKNNGLIIGGIYSTFIGLTPEKRTEYSTDLSNIMLEKLKDVQLIHIITTLQLMDKIGREPYFDIIKNLDEEHELNDTTFQFIRDSIPDINYILLGNINNEHVVAEEYEEHVDSDHIQTTYSKTYMLTVEFQIYDLTQEEIVYRRHIYNQAGKSESRRTRSGCLESLTDNIIRTLICGNPAEIEREEILVIIYKRFAKKLSKL